MELIGYRKFDSAEVAYNEEDGYLYLNYLKESTSEDFRALWHYVFELTEKHPHNKTFINQRRQNVFPADQKWLIDEGALIAKERLPQSQENPRRVALLVAQNFYIEYITEEYINSKNVGRSSIRTFNDEEEALKWLLME